MNEKILTTLQRIQREWGGLTDDVLSSIRMRLNDEKNVNQNGFLTWNLYSLATWYERWFK